MSNEAGVTVILIPPVGRTEGAKLFNTTLPAVVSTLPASVTTIVSLPPTIL